jgi:hypothetical protein
MELMEYKKKAKKEIALNIINQIADSKYEIFMRTGLKRDNVP